MKSNIQRYGDNCWLLPTQDERYFYQKYGINEFQYPFRLVVKKDTYEVIGRWRITKYNETYTKT